MCGRYFIATEQDESEINKIIQQINDRYKDKAVLAEMKTQEVFPTNIAPVITAYFPSLMKWGFSRYDGNGQIINARLETVTEKPMFRKSFAENRCLIPASYFFEWEKRGRSKQKYAIGSNGIIYMAGLYRLMKDSHLPRFVILTRPAAPGISFMHDRMPVILHKDIHAAWLAGAIDNNRIFEYSIENLSFKEVG